MEVELLTDFFDRILGAFIFIAAVGVVVFSVNRLSTSTSQVKENYANDAVYSEASLAETDESVVSRDELVAMLLSSPNQNITIRDEVSNLGMVIKSGLGVNNTMKVFSLDNHEKVEANLSFGTNKWIESSLKLDKWLQAKEYSIHTVTNFDGTVKSVLYYGVQ